MCRGVCPGEKYLDIDWSESWLDQTFVIEGVDLCLAGAELEKEGEAVHRVVLHCQVIASLPTAGLLPTRCPGLQEVRHQAGLVVVYSDVERSLARILNHQSQHRVRIIRKITKPCLFQMSRDFPKANKTVEYLVTSLLLPSRTALWSGLKI